MLVREWMTAPATAISPMMDAGEALEQMIEWRYRRFPVAQDGKLVGIVTRGDLEAKLGWDRLLWRRLRRHVSDAMTPNPFTVGPEEPFEKAVELMLKHRIGGIPVVDAGKLVGIVTESDVFRAFAHLTAQMTAAVGR